MKIQKVDLSYVSCTYSTSLFLFLLQRGSLKHCKITCQKYYFWNDPHYFYFLINNLDPSKPAKAKSSPEAFPCIHHKFSRKLYRGRFENEIQNM